MSQKKSKITVIHSDGICPEVINENVKVINATCETLNMNIEWEYFPFGADYYLSIGKLFTDDDLKTLSKFNTIYFGAVGDPSVKPKVLEKGAVLAIRFYFDQYTNLRPIKLLRPDKIRNLDHDMSLSAATKYVANLIAAIWSDTLILRELGLVEGYNIIFNTVVEVLKKKRIRTYDLRDSSKIYKVSDEIAKKIQEKILE